MPTTPDAETTRLRHFNHEVIAQALALVARFEAPGAPAYAGPVGSHLRHIVEHYDALLAPPVPGEVDYDQRPRDRVLERCSAVAGRRLLALQQRLSETGAALDTPVRVLGRAGLGGEFEFSVASTLGRELVFVGSHAVHHYALLQTWCRQHGIDTGADFGKAPATVAHERTASGALAA
jgi:hypothetical protein